MPGRRALVVALAVALLAGVVTVVTLLRRGSDCLPDDHTLSAADVSPPFDASPADPRSRRLAQTAATWGAGEVVGSLGYDHDQYVSLAAVGDGTRDRMLVWRKGTPVMVALADGTDGTDGEPAWGLRQAAGRRTWDASATRFVTLLAPRGERPQLASLQLRDGSRTWCRTLEHPALRRADPISTAVAADGSVVVLTGTGDRQRITRLAGDGSQEWSRRVGVAGGDSLTWAGDVLLAGTTLPERTAGDPLVALDAATGRKLWDYTADGVVRVVGVSGDRVLVHRESAGQHTLSALTTGTGAVEWQVPLGRGVPDLAVRGDVVLERTPTALGARSILDGHRAWQRPLRRTPQFFPYGFTLARAGYLGDRVLLAGTDGLHLLDPATGDMRTWALPTDGINTTFWPYQVAATSRSFAVATNTATVLLRR